MIMVVSVAGQAFLGLTQLEYPKTVGQMGLDARKPVFGVFDQQRRRSACASAQTDKRLYYSLFEQYHI